MLIKLLKKLLQLFHLGFNKKPKKKEDKIKRSEAFRDYQSLRTLEGDLSFLLDEMEDFAKKNLKYREDLIDVFENYAKDVQSKLWLSDILVKVNYKPVVNFLVEVLEGAEKYSWTKSLNQKIDKAWFLVEIWAACNLVWMNDKRGEIFLREKIKIMSKEEVKLLANELFFESLEEEPYADLSIRFLIDLAHNHDVMKKCLGKELDSLEKKMAELDKKKLNK